MENQKTMDAAVTFDRVTKIHPMGEVQVTALKSISLQIPRKRFSMFVGPSGSGKTTLLNLVGCIDLATQGEVKVFGQRVDLLNDDEISEFRAKNVSFIFQTFNLIHVLTAYENVEYPLVLLGVSPEERASRTWRMLQHVGLERFAHHRPNQLSGGQRQRVAIARALVKGPGLVLADEPTANLDSGTGAAIIELMQKAQEEEGATFLFSTHDPLLISHAQEVFILKDGELVEHRTEAR